MKVLKAGPSLEGGGGHRTLFSSLHCCLYQTMSLRELEPRREGEEVSNNGGELERRTNSLSLEGAEQQQPGHLLDSDLKGST